MPLTVFFLVFLLLQIPAYIAVMVLSAASHPWLFFGAEALLVADIAASVIFYRRVVRPLNILNGAMSMLESSDWNSTLRPTGQPEVDSLVAVFNKMMRNLHSQRVQMLEQRHFLSLLVEVTPSGIIVCGFDGKVRMCNPAARRMLGTDEPDDRLRAIPDGGELTIRRPDGMLLRCMRRHFLEDGVRQTFFIIENLTEPVASAEKEAYEKLIRLMAHEVNNTVTGLSTALSALEGYDTDSDALIASCRERALALSDFIGRFANVVRLPEPTLTPISLGASVKAMAPFLESLCTPRRTALRLEIPESCITVYADATMLEQVIVNIVKNAAESIGSGGEITVSVSAAPATLTVTDNGPGISAEKSARLFTPFFTDKPGGQGIGLTFVREALRRHKCRFSLSTSPDDGLTRFTIIFP